MNIPYVNQSDVRVNLIDNYNSEAATLKIEVDLINVKLIPSYSWIDKSIASEMPHNVRGPAFVSYVQCYWYVDGIREFSTKSYCSRANFDDETTLNWVLCYGDTLPSMPSDVRNLPVNFRF